MTTREGPEPCHYDRTLGERVTRRHRDTCITPSTHRGCAPCTAPHCVVCGREHLDNAHPVTCETCVIAVQHDDLDEIRLAYAALATEALDATTGGQLVAAAPIPGGTAAVLIGPTVRLDLLRVSYHTREDHAVDRRGRSHDPMPPLAILAQWEDMWRAWFGHQRGHRKATIGAAIAYLRDQVPSMAQQKSGGPDWLAFTKQIRQLRAQLERALHDEREPEVGVECFECGHQLVRRFRVPRPCRHTTPARELVGFWLRLGYREALATSHWRAARVPCGACSQGGLDDPSAGQSWECPGCRKEYKADEYATAVRRDLLDSETDGDGWTHITMAAEAATTLTGHLVPASTVRKWMDRGRVAALCVWRCDQAEDGTLAPVPWGMRLVYWPDVADAAVAAVRRMLEVEQERRRRARQFEDWSSAVAEGEDEREASDRLGIHPQRLEAFIGERERIGA